MTQRNETVTKDKGPFSTKHYAAIDLGSNSFHLAIGMLEHGELRWQYRMSEKVQLALGIQEDNTLDPQTQAQALTCLARFRDRVSMIAPENIRIVGTNALRVIRSKSEFLRQIEAYFSQRVDIIAGREEARLIYLGVSQTTPENEKKALVIDIGGGSTEFIIGQNFQPLLTESLHMGCVSFKKDYFANGKLSKANFKRAIAATEQQVQHISSQYKTLGWDTALGASGSVKSIFAALKGLSRETQALTLEDLEFLIDHLQAFEEIDNIKLPTLKPERFPIFPSGLAILYGIMKHLEIRSLRYSEGALREGLIYDLLGRLEPENVRIRTLESIQKRFSVDKSHGKQVRKTAIHFARQMLSDSGALNNALYFDALSFAAETHEIGLSISHTQFHKHGAYILTHADLPGFSQQEQLVIATLVRLHRRKFSPSALDQTPAQFRRTTKILASALRLSVLLHHSRIRSSKNIIKNITLQRRDSDNDEITLLLSVQSEWILEHPLVQLDVEAEASLLAKGGILLKLEVLG